MWITTTLMSLLLVFSNTGQTSNKHDNRHHVEKKRDQSYTNSRKSDKRKVRHEHKKRARHHVSKHRSRVSVNSHTGRRDYRKHSRHAGHRYYSSYGYEPYYARSHNDYYGRYYGFYDRHGNYREYDYGYYDSYGSHHAHHHGAHCGHLATPILGAVVAGIVIASIFD